MDATLRRLETPAPDGAEIAERLRRGEFVSDREFDLLLQPRWRAASVVHWSHLSSCIQAAHFLAGPDGAQVLDVGSGAGKFCVVGSLVTQGTFVGVEHVSELVDQAESLRGATGATAEFIAADAFAVNWSDFGAFYFYNTFEEYNFPALERLHESIPTSRDLFEQKVRGAHARLAFMPTGTRVATYNGLGVDMPRSYRLVGSCEPAGVSVLQFWVQE